MAVVGNQRCLVRLQNLMSGRPERHLQAGCLSLIVSITNQQPPGSGTVKRRRMQLTANLYNRVTLVSE